MAEISSRKHAFEYSRIFLLSALQYTIYTNQRVLELEIYDKLG